MQLFKKCDLMLMHMMSRLLTHEAELVTIQFKNSTNEKSHRVFVKNEMMIMMIMYHKKIETNKKIKIIHHYLPHKMRELMLYHM